MYIADQYNHRIRKVTVSTGIITTFAGSGSTGVYSGDGGAATSAGLNYPCGIAFDTSGNVYIGDTSNNRIRKVTVSTGIITTFAGTGTGAYSGDNGQSTSAKLQSPVGIALDSSDNVYFADMSNNRVRKVTVGGIITTLAGTGTASYSGDNSAATSATLNLPTGVVIDSAGNIYIADQYNHRIRKITVATGIITTHAGNGGTGSYSGDNSAATSANLYYPRNIAFDSQGNMYIADSTNYRIRKVTTSTGTISTYAGSGGTSGSYSGDNGAATSAGFNAPSGVALDSSNNLYISDTNNHRIRKVTVTTSFPR